MNNYSVDVIPINMGQGWGIPSRQRRNIQSKGYCSSRAGRAHSHNWYAGWNPALSIAKSW